MAFHIFRSAKEPEWHAVSSDAEGATLPDHLGPWHRSSLAEPPTNADEVRFEEVLARDGFYLFRA